VHAANWCGVADLLTSHVRKNVPTIPPTGMPGSYVRTNEVSPRLPTARTLNSYPSAKGFVRSIVGIGTDDRVFVGNGQRGYNFFGQLGTTP